MSVAAKSELLNVLSDVKARALDKLGVVDFPLPQFILLGKQSVGKSRLIEALAGEQFNFCSGTMGSRRPTVLEFRHVASRPASRWFVRDRKSGVWAEEPLRQVQTIIGEAHEELGLNVSSEPVYVRIESPLCVDMQIVDLPGFRDFALDVKQQDLNKKIEVLVESFMAETRNVMICVEQAGDAATMSTLQRCRRHDPKLTRTIVVRNKLDKYYSDLSPDNVNKWVDGFGDLPESLVRFALTLPWWQDGMGCPKDFGELRSEMDQRDVTTMQSKGLGAKYLQTIGFQNFASYMERRIEHMFVDSLGPVLSSLKSLKETTEKKEVDLVSEYHETEPHRILSTIRECGSSFATALNHVMEGVLSVTEGRMTLPQELTKFHADHKALASESFDTLPSEDFVDLPAYLGYLQDEIEIGAFDVEVNGGVQFRRLMTEVEVFLRLSEIDVEISKRHFLSARGASTSPRDIVVKLLQSVAQLPLQRRVQYVGERIKWFFSIQKVAVLDFMDHLEGTPKANCYSPLYPKHAKLLKTNDMVKNLVFESYDRACDRQLKQFIEFFENMMTSAFSNPWNFVRNATMADATDATMEAQPQVKEEFGHTKKRIPEMIQSRSAIDATLTKGLAEIPSDLHQIDEAVDKVQVLILKIYSCIRSNVCDQVELLGESFFKLPMLRRLVEDMSQIELSEQDQSKYQQQRARLANEVQVCQSSLVEINTCMQRLQGFSRQCVTRGGGAGR